MKQDMKMKPKNKIERILIEKYKTIYSFKGNNKQIEIPKILICEVSQLIFLL